MPTPSYPVLIDPDDALQRVLAATPPAPIRALPLAEADGLVLAEELAADRDYPPFDRALMDGVAARLADAGRTLPVAGEIPAGRPWPGPLPPGAVLEIMTGAPVPPGAEVVIPREVLSTPAPGMVTLPSALRTGQHIMPRGREATAGQPLLRAGQVLTPVALGVAAALGRTHLRVPAPPSVALIITGDEILPPATAPAEANSDSTPGAIRDSNGPLLAAMLRRLGIRALTQCYCGDTPAALAAALQQAFAAAGPHGFIILTGGVSAGRYDLVPELLQQAGARIVFHKINQRPGKPLLFAVRPTPGAEDPTATQLIFGLPGNPLACQLGMHRYIAAALRHHLGLPPRPRLTGQLATGLTVTGDRLFFQLALAEWRDAAWWLTPLRGQGSADLYAATTANAMLRLVPAPDPFPPATALEFEFLD
jgi:molybdopterin molybdotransferase